MHHLRELERPVAAHVVAALASQTAAGGVGDGFGRSTGVTQLDVDGVDDGLNVLSQQVPGVHLDHAVMGSSSVCRQLTMT